MILFPGMLLGQCFNRGNWRSFPALIVGSAVWGMAFYLPSGMAAYYFEWPHRYIFAYYFIGAAFLIFINRVKEVPFTFLRVSVQKIAEEEWFFYLFSAVAAVFIGVISRYYYWGADTWAHLSEIRDLAQEPYIRPFGAIHLGNHYIPAYAYNLVYLLWAHIAVVSHADFVYVWQALSGILTFIGLCAARLLVSSFFSDLLHQYVVAVLFVWLYFVFYIFYEWGLPYFIFIAQPCTVAEFLIFPYLVFHAFQYLDSEDNSESIWAVVVLPALLLAVHVQYALAYYLFVVSYAGFRAFKNKQARRFILLAGMSLFPAAPLVLLKIIAIVNSPTVLLTDSAEELLLAYQNNWIKADGRLSMVDPRIFSQLNWVTVVAAILYFIQNRQKSFSGLAITSLIVSAFLVFNPWLTPVVARAISPYIAVRIFGLALSTIGIYALLYYIASICLYLWRRFRLNTGKFSLNTLFIILLAVLTIFFMPKLPSKLSDFSFKKLNLHTLSQDPLVAFLRQRPPNQVILSDKRISYLLPALVNHYVVQTRTNAAIYDGLERSQLFVDAMAPDVLMDDRLVGAFRKYQVNLIVLDRRSPFQRDGLNKLRQCPGLFKEVFSDGDRVVLEVTADIESPKGVCAFHISPEFYDVTTGLGPKRISLDRWFDMPADKPEVKNLFDGSFTSGVSWQSGQTLRLFIGSDADYMLNKLTLHMQNGEGASSRGVILYASSPSGGRFRLEEKSVGGVLKARMQEYKLQVGHKVKDIEIEIVGDYENPIQLSEVVLQ